MAGPGISLKDLIDRFQFSQDQLNKQVGDEHLTKASEIIADHKILGPRLGLTEQDMTAIDRNEITHELKKEAMLKKWKQKFAWKATYRELIESLLKCSRADYAQQVCELLAQSVSPEQPSGNVVLTASPTTPSVTCDGAINTGGEAHATEPEGSESLTSSTVSSPSCKGASNQFPNASSSDDEVKRKVKHFTKRFNEMTSDTRVALQKSNTSPKEVIVLLTMPSAYLETRDEHMEFLDTLKEAADILDLFIALNKYWDHFNYHLLEHLITAPGIERYIEGEKCAQLQEQMKQYVEEMDEFRRQATLGVYCKIFVKQRKEVPRSFKELVTMHNWSEMNTLQDVEDFRQEVAREYQLHKCLVFFKNILFCSVEVIWWIPIVTPLPSIGPQLQGSCTVEEHVNTEACYEEEQSESAQSSKSYETPPNSPASQPVVVSDDPSPPGTSSTHRKEEVAKKASQLEDQFMDVVTNAKIEFSKSSKPPSFLNELRNTLTKLPISQRFKHLYFLRKQRQRITNAKSVDEIFTILDDFWDYTDYALLQHLVEKFGEDALKKQMSEYVATLERFERNTTIQENNIARSDRRRRIYTTDIFGNDYSTVWLQLSRDHAVYTLYEVRELEESVARRACLEPYALRLQKVRQSLVAITLMCPHVALELMLEALGKNFLETHKIVSVIIDRKPLEEYSEEYVKGLQLLRASEEGDEATVTSLLQSGMNPNFSHRHGETALHWASCEGQIAVVSVLLDHGADVHAVDEYGKSALHWASHAGQTAAVQLLFDHRADVHAATKYVSKTALHMASERDHHKTVQLLLERGADPNRLDQGQRTAVMRAAMRGHTHTVEALARARANLNVRDEEGYTALMWATLKGHSETVRVLVQHGADLNVQNKKGLTALMIAVKEGQTAIVNTLVDSRADVNVQENTTGWAALFFAAKEGHLEIARKLIGAGADILLRDQNGVTAVDVARVCGREELCELLSTSTPPSLHTSPSHKEEATPPITTPPPTTEPQQAKEIAISPAPDQKRQALETFWKLVNKSVRRITEMYQDLDRRLKNTAEKEQRKMASNQDKRDLEDTHESTLVITLDVY